MALSVALIVQHLGCSKFGAHSSWLLSRSDSVLVQNLDLIHASMSVFSGLRLEHVLLVIGRP